MSEATPRPTDTLNDRDAWREALRRRMAEAGLTLHIPPPGGRWQPPAVPLPFTGDELSEMVLRMRRGED
jgi:hypothetical protein